MCVVISFASGLMLYYIFTCFTNGCLMITQKESEEGSWAQVWIFCMQYFEVERFAMI